MVSRPIQFSTDAAGPLYAFSASEADFTDWLADRIAVTLAAGRASVTLDDAHDWYVFDGSTAPTNWDQNIAFVDFSQFRQLNTLQQLLSGGSAMAILLSEVDEDQVGTGVLMSGPCTVFVRGNLAGATVALQVSDEDVSASYVKPDKGVLREGRISASGAVAVNGNGDYYLRAVLQGATPGVTEVTVVALQ